MREGWQTTKFGNVCTLDRVHSKGAALPYVGLEDIVGGEGQFTGSTEPKKVQSSTFQFTSGHLLYGRLRPYLNKVFLPDFDGHCSTEIFPIRPAPNVDRRYLYYWLSTDMIAKKIDYTSTGARMPRANMDAVLEFPIWLPPLAEQQRIVAILDEAFAGLATATDNAVKNLKNARELFQATIHSALTGARADTDAWPPAPLSSLVIEGRGISYGVVKPGRHDPSGVRVIKSQQVRDGWVDLAEDFRITKELDKEYSRTRLQGGEVLLNLVGASIGRSAIAPNEIRGANVTRAIAVIPVHHELSAWVQYNLHAHAGQQLIKSSTGGTAQPVLNLGDVKNLPIPMPPKAVREKVVANLNAAREGANGLEVLYKQKYESLSDLRQAILQKAFAGKLTSPRVAPTKAQAAIAGISATDLHAGVIAIAYQKHQGHLKQNTFGHVKAEKIAHLVEARVGIDLGRHPIKDAAGPNDYPHLMKVEHRANMAGYFSVKRLADGTYAFSKKNKFDEIVRRSRAALGERNQAVDSVIDMMLPMDTQQAEILATVFAAWNNLLLDGRSPNEETIVREARENWHPDKLAIDRARFFSAIEWMKKNNVIPNGEGKKVVERTK